MVGHRLPEIDRYSYRTRPLVGTPEVSSRWDGSSVHLLMGFCVRFIPGSQHPSMQRVISASLFLHPGFLIVDHIHFQYNGFMYGILLWSLLMARNVSNPFPAMTILDVRYRAIPSRVGFYLLCY